MTGKTFPALILAAGYGSLRPNVPKVIESISSREDRPMIVEVVKSIKTTVFSCFELKPILIVNELYRGVIANCLQAHGHFECYFVIQPDRYGAGDAVLRAIPFLQENGWREFLVVFADMPLWRPETIKHLVLEHLHEMPAISMVTAVREALSVFCHYGRILRGLNDEITGVVEPVDATIEQLASKTVNPSLYVFDLAFFVEKICQVEPKERGDGRPPEIYLPPLVEIAHKAGRKILDVPLENPIEAIGVNTLAELEEVRRIVDG
jgi:bifunctional N-acetylglucosamine-1-phosphate-uridyltransferase/glucosamine-1-phosphate-acetyltransferase GlmU-like protein